MAGLWDDATGPFTGQPQMPDDGSLLSRLYSLLSSQGGGASIFPASDPSMGQSMFSAEPQSITTSADPSIQPTLALRDPERQQQAMDIALSFGPAAIRGVPGLITGGAPREAVAQEGLRGFHGTGRRFEDFDQGYAGQKNAIFFTPDAKEAASFGKNVMERQLDVSNPQTIDWGGGHYRQERMNDAIQAAKDAGNDALIVNNIKNAVGRDPSTTYVVWDTGKIQPAARQLNPSGGQ